ncbi:uncharacterized protein BO88DRAFT_135779 [Aspergillus vadensis CBS 113365]|uniref:Uncharacterized protein n=1 Tax=Aspergillus vadensis (strain CBS 113365 / IMI 142717 / IBT 24658) TaxID=1448311 RepID=A0A319B1V0_ASPVC|nr:hypothetical protein BO88DRAFT_135779 [Aspergillus vadensis CBS 113365]PYH65681.1 hypothetical protein BO88DRAFT_135779 [Aspergillus vadensis CBS 113365]
MRSTVTCLLVIQQPVWFGTSCFAYLVAGPRSHSSRSTSPYEDYDQMMLDGSFPARRAHPDTCRCRYIAAYATQLSHGSWWIASLMTGEYIFRAAALSHHCLYLPALCSTRVCRCDA